MYFLFTEKNVMPSEYNRMSEGEKIIAHAFFEKTMEARQRR
jgi:hypothetical protein